MGLADSMLTNLGLIQKAKISVFFEGKVDGEIKEESASSGNGNGLGGSLSPAAMLGGGPGVDKMDFTVQFNPSTLRFNGQGGDMVQKTSYANGTESSKKKGKSASIISYEPAEPRITMRVKLIFDEVTWADMDYGVAAKAEALVAATAASAATSGSFGVSTGQIAAVTAMDAFELGAKKAIRALTPTHKVKDRTEAFLAIVRNNYSNAVQFAWGHMLYKGIVNNVSAEYTMFTSDGEPLRSSVDFEMVLLDEDLGATNRGMWENAYKQVFQDSASAVGTMQSWGENFFSM